MADSEDTSAAYSPTPASDAGVPGPDPSRIARTRVSWQRNRLRSLAQEWREEFPYHWSADDLVTRRDTLRFLLAGSGALFVASATLAVVGIARPQATGQPLAIANVDELAENESKVFTYPDQFSQGILVNLPGKGLVAYSDVCTHLSCAVLYLPGSQKFHCPCHEGYFDAATGNALAGPPIRPLPLIELQVRDGVVYAVRQVER
jgi:Rieske Fe-S protein